MEQHASSYFSIVARHWKLLALITLIPTILAIIAVFFILKPVYEGKTSVIFPLKQSASFMRRSLSDLDIPVSGMSSLLSASPTLYNHIVIIESRNLAARVYNYLKTEKNVDMLDYYEDIRDDSELKEDPERMMQAVYKRMQKRIEVSDLDRGMATVIFTHANPEIAAIVANSYITETLDFLNEVNKNTQSDLVTFLTARQLEVENALQTAETEIQQVKEETGILSVEEQARQIITSYADIEALVAQAEIDYQGSLSQAGSMADAGMDMEDYYAILAAGETPGGDMPVPAIDALADSTIANLRSELAKLELERQETMLWATPDNPQLLLLDSQIKSVARELYREFSDYYDAAQASLIVESTAYKAQLDVAQEVLNELDARLDQFPPEERRLIELERERDVQESIYLVVTQELEQARIQELRDQEPFTILDEALTPNKPVRPRKAVITAATFALSMWLGLMIIFWVDADIRRRSEEKKG